MISAKPIDFVYDLANNQYDVSYMESDEELVRLVQSGYSGKHIYRMRDDEFIDVKKIFRNTEP